MTFKLISNTQGAVLETNGTNAANINAASGIPFCKNKLFNGEVTRINQRAFNGTWSGKNTWETQAATIADKETSYGYDMWFRSNAARSDGTSGSDNMAQWIESGNYRPNTVHTISGTGVTTANITSPASGNWKIVVAQGATNVQVEEGLVATPFEIRPIGFELAQCQRYFEATYQWVPPTASAAQCWFKVTKRAAVAYISGGGSGYSTGSILTTDSYYASQTTGAFQTLFHSAVI